MKDPREVFKGQAYKELVLLLPTLFQLEVSHMVMPDYIIGRTTNILGLMIIITIFKASTMIIAIIVADSF